MSISFSMLSTPNKNTIYSSIFNLNANLFLPMHMLSINKLKNTIYVSFLFMEGIFLIPFRNGT